MSTTFRLPPEWARQAAVQLTWPHAHGDWGEDLAAAQDCLLQIAGAIGLRQPVLITCADAAQQAQIARQLGAAGVPAKHLLLSVQPSDDVWARDHGPLTVCAAGRRRLLNLRFNGWGGKYPHARDNELTPRLQAAGIYAGLGIDERADINYILEGGAIEVDGAGTLLTTSRCLLSATRNPGMDRAAYARLFAEHFGVEQVLWLDHGGLRGDDTDGHIDTLARFAAPDTILYQDCDDATDEHHADLQAMATQLASFRQTNGQPYSLFALPWPEPQYDRHGRRLPATYANFLIINDAVLVPVYACAADARALAVLTRCFPHREIVPIDCRALIRQGGSLHCVSMQIPAAHLT